MSAMTTFRKKIPRMRSSIFFLNCQIKCPTLGSGRSSNTVPVHSIEHAQQYSWCSLKIFAVSLIQRIRLSSDLGQDPSFHPVPCFHQAPYYFQAPCYHPVPPFQGVDAQSEPDRRAKEDKRRDKIADKCSKFHESDEVQGRGRSRSSQKGKKTKSQ